MKQILAIPKMSFDKNFNDDIIRSYSYACFISIIDMDNDENLYKDGDNFLQVKMWDIEEDIYENDVLKYEKPSDNILQKIVDFINYHKDKSVFIVHCSAGISRSGAVATYIKNKFHSEVDKEKFMRDNKNIMPNIYILNKLIDLDVYV